MKKRVVKPLYFFFLALILLLSGCGIPNIYVPDSSDVSVSSSNLTLSGDMVDSTLIKNGYPQLALFYQIIPTGATTSGFSNVCTHFNNTVANKTNGTRISASSINQAYLNRSYTATVNGSSDTLSYGLYQFYVDESDSITAFFKDIQLDDNTTKVVWNLTFDYSSTDGSLTLTITTDKTPTGSSDESVIYKLKRYNKKNFTQNTSNNGYDFFAQEIPEKFRDDNTITSYTLNVYAVVSAEFESYNNIYNTTISYLNPIFTTSID